MSAIASPVLPARWWHAGEGQKVVCTLCPRQCHIPVGGRGFCFVRANVGGRLELTTYGRSSGFCIDPVEKKPLNHFLPGTPILSFGTAGCNLGCKFCQNWDISRSRQMDTLAAQASPEAIVAAAVRTGCRSLAFTYNDPVIWAEYAIDIAKLARAQGIKTVAVTAGYISREARGEFYQHMDAANVDLKAFTDGFYRRLCQGQLEPVLDGLKFLKRETQVWFELTNLIIPGENDSGDETRAMCGWIAEKLGADVPVHFTAFHPDFKMPATPATPLETLLRARQIALAAGIRYAYVGNVSDTENESTFCHACGKLLIRRQRYQIGAYHLRGNTCGHCGAVIPGVFEDGGPGRWGAKRQPIMVSGDATHVDEARKNMTRTAPETSATQHGSLNITVAGATLGTSRMAAAPAAKPGGAAPQGVATQVDFTAEQEAQILAYTRAVVESALRGEYFPSARLPESLAQVPTYGLFVSLHRAAQLRSCKGRMGAPDGGGLMPLGQLLGTIARDAVANDPRFPRVSAQELPYLNIEVSLLHSPQAVAARGRDRLGYVHVGTHGLVIMHPHGHGLLLPHVATEAGWDAETFLEQVCRKAGLPPQAWRENQAKLMTFQARRIEMPSLATELDLTEVGAQGLTQLFEVVQQLVSGQEQGMASEAQAPLLHRTHPEELGLCLLTASGAKGVAIGLNHSLLSLAKAAVQSLANGSGQPRQSEPVQTMTMLWRPLALAAADYPARHQTLASCAVLAQATGRWSLAVPQPDGRSDPVAQALATLELTQQRWLEDRTGQVRVTAFNVLHCRNGSGREPVPAPGRTAVAQVRPAFRAGTFYPGDAVQCLAEVESSLRAGGLGSASAQAYRAIMLPHAGWRFCGSTIGKTLAGVKLPKTLIILGPRHTPLGPACSVASHAAWQIPGATVPVATSLARRLAQAVPQLACEPEAHRQEHAIEVLLPFLHRLRPDLQIVPIVLGMCDGGTLTALARELAAILREASPEDRPLLVVSSDMNHYAPEAENRRRDKLALDAMQTGDPQTLYETCVKNDVSMCGLLPAVVVLQALAYQAPSPQPRCVDYTTSAAASGDASRVVGYAGVVIA